MFDLCEVGGEELGVVKDVLTVAEDLGGGDAGGFINGYLRSLLAIEVVAKLRGNLPNTPSTTLPLFMLRQIVREAPTTGLAMDDIQLEMFFSAGWPA